MPIKSKINQLLADRGALNYLHNTGWLIAEKMLRLLSGLVVGVLVARFLGPEKYGLLNYAISFVALFLAFSTLGLDSIVVKELVNQKDRKAVILGTSFYLKLAASFLVLIMVAVALLLSNETTEVKGMMAILATAGLFQSFSVVEYYFQSEVKSKRVVYVNMIALGATSILKVVLIVSKASLPYFALAAVLDTIIVSLGLVYVYKLSGHKLTEWTFDRVVASNLLWQSWPLVLAGVVITVYMKIDQIMVKELLSAEANGYYSAAVRISETWYFIPMAICNSLFPAIVNAKNRNDGSSEIRLQRLFDFLVLLAFSVAIPMIFIAKPLILLLFGDNFVQAADVLTIHIWAGVFVSLGVSGSLWLVNENLQIYSFFRSFAGAITNIVLNFIFIPKFGIMGAAMTTLFSQFLAAFFFDVFFKRTQGVFMMKLKALFLINYIKKIFRF